MAEDKNVKKLDKETLENISGGSEGIHKPPSRKHDSPKASNDKLDRKEAPVKG